MGCGTKVEPEIHAQNIIFLGNMKTKIKGGQEYLREQGGGGLL